MGAKHTSTLDTVYNIGNLYKDRGEIDKASEMYGRTAEGYEDAEDDHEADVVDCCEQLSLLVAKAAEADDNRQPIGQQPLISCAQRPTRASVDSGDTANTQNIAEAACVRDKKCDVISRILNRRSMSWRQSHCIQYQ